MLRRCLLLTLFGGFLWSLPTYAEDRFGHVDFELWSLDWEINDDTGLALRNVFFDHEKVLAKASMPVIRVKYDKERHWWNPFSLGGSREATGRCGPFQDRLSWTNIIPIVDCGDQKVCARPTSTAASSGWRSASMHGSGNTIFIKSGISPRTDKSIPSCIAAACHATPIMCTIRTGDSMSTSMGTASTKSSGTTRMPRTPAGDRDGTSIQMRSTTPSSPPPIGCGSFATNPPVTAYGLFPDLPIVPSLKTPPHATSFRIWILQFGATNDGRTSRGLSRRGVNWLMMTAREFRSKTSSSGMSDISHTSLRWVRRHGS